MSMQSLVLTEPAAHSSCQSHHEGMLHTHYEGMLHTHYEGTLHTFPVNLTMRACCTLFLSSSL